MLVYVPVCIDMYPDASNEHTFYSFSFQCTGRTVKSTNCSSNTYAYNASLELHEGALNTTRQNDKGRMMNKFSWTGRVITGCWDRLLQ